MAEISGSSSAHGPSGRPLRVAVLLGSRANEWHCEVFHDLAPDIEPTLVVTSQPRYPVGARGLPKITLPFANERGSWFRRKLHNLRYRIEHPRNGFEMTLDPEPDALADFDVLLSWELFTEWTRVALQEKRRRGVPVGVVVWDNIPRHFTDHPQRGPIRARALAEADSFYVVSARSEYALRLDGVPAARVVRGRPAVDLERFRPRTGAGEPAMRERMGASPDDILVVTVARLEEGKGVRYLLQAVAGASAWIPALRVAVVGDGPAAAELQRHARDLGIGGRTKFVPELAYADMPALHRAADIFVLASIPTPDWQEQWGQSLLEAMASGTASIGTRSGGIPELLDIGELSPLVAPGDAYELGNAVLHLARNPSHRELLGRLLRERAVERFDLEAEADRLSDFLRRLAGREVAHD